MNTSPSRFNHVLATLVLALAFIYLVPFVPFLYAHVLSILLILLGLIAVMAAVKRAWVDVGIALLLAAVFGLGRIKFNLVDTETYLFRTAAISAFVFLHFTLFIGPWSRFTSFFQRFYKYRRHIGVTAYLLAMLHASTVFRVYFLNSVSNAWLSSFVFFGFTTLFIMTLLALTSWDVVQKKVPYKAWVVIHLLALFAYLGMMLAFFQITLDLMPWQKWTLGGFVVLWLLLAPWSLPRAILRRVNGWKQLHVLIYIGYISIIIHVWMGVGGALPVWLQAAFWMLVVAVVGSHACGWVMMLRDRLRARKNAADTIRSDGKTYQYTDLVNTFIEGKGRRFLVGGQPLAVFLHSGKFFALSNTCPHQGGPICDGKIVNGFVECPWHKYQFGVTDGFGPPEFHDCIPYYPVRVQNEKVYVCTESTGKCKK